MLSTCSRLRYLSVDNAAVEWGEEGLSSEQQHTSLLTAQLGRSVGACAIMALLSWAPELRVLHLHSCPDLGSHHLSYVSKHSQVKWGLYM